MTFKSPLSVRSTPVHPTLLDGEEQTDFVQVAYIIIIIIHSLPSFYDFREPGEYPITLIFFCEIATLIIMFLNTDEFNMGNQSMTSSNLNLPSNYRDLTDLLLINRRTCAHRATDFQMDLSRVRNKQQNNLGALHWTDNQS